MGEYEYKWQKFEIEPQDATSNAFAAVGRLRAAAVPNKARTRRCP